MPDTVVIATWPFGQTAVKTALPLLAGGQAGPWTRRSRAARAVEDDPSVNSVGYGGLANAIGTVQLDACVMDGQTLSCGAVAGLENVRHAAAVAHRVMEKTPHVLLVGAGAQLFALQEGFPLETLLTPESVAEWEKKRPGEAEAAGDQALEGRVAARSRHGHGAGPGQKGHAGRRLHHVGPGSSCLAASAIRRSSAPGYTSTTRRERPVPPASARKSSASAAIISSWRRCGPANHRRRRASWRCAR